MWNYFKMKNNMTGVLVTKINELSHADESLEENDVILEVDGCSNGSICGILINYFGDL